MAVGADKLTALLRINCLRFVRYAVSRRPFSQCERRAPVR